MAGSLPDQEIAGIVDHLAETHLNPDGFEDDDNVLNEQPHQKNPSPASNVPEELVSEILLACLSRPSDVPLMSREGRLWFSTLRSVCSRWRSVAFSTPRLWTSVELQGPWSADDLALYPRRLRAWFDRGGDLPLRLGIYGDVDFATPSQPLQELLLVTADHRNWDFVAVFTTSMRTNNWLLEQVATKQPSPWQNVTAMLLPASDSSLEQNDAGSFDLIASQLPSLWRLVIVASDPAYSFKPTVAHSALRVLQITAFDQHQYTACPTLLTVFQNLSTLHLDGHLPFRPPFPPQFVVHERLRAFIVCSDAHEALDYFTFPALRRLVFTPRKVQPLPLTSMLDEQFLLSFIARSQCPLRFLALHWLSFTEQGLSKILRSLPHPEVFETLTLSSPSFVRHLNYKWDEASETLATPDLLILPQLVEILAYGQEPTVDDHKLLQLYWNTRCDQLKALQPLRASPWPPVSFFIFPPLGGSFEEPISNWARSVETLSGEEDDTSSTLNLTVCDSGEPSSQFERDMRTPVTVTDLDGQDGK
jgi:F-box-like